MRNLIAAVGIAGVVALSLTACGNTDCEKKAAGQSKGIVDIVVVPHPVIVEPHVEPVVPVEHEPVGGTSKGITPFIPWVHSGSNTCS